MRSSSSLCVSLRQTPSPPASRLGRRGSPPPPEHTVPEFCWARQRPPHRGVLSGGVTGDGPQRRLLLEIKDSEGRRLHLPSSFTASPQQEVHYLLVTCDSTVTAQSGGSLRRRRQTGSLCRASCTRQKNATVEREKRSRVFDILKCGLHLPDIQTTCSESPPVIHEGAELPPTPFPSRLIILLS
ncbi:unnamed protein product [Pleuronectes platessa]|uniref:Uncharacterized protein n=1 Tax=Pleuronectes platessa TaxID=8262 RepID=A0A9N7Z7F1_PLEPL|nr:unnamed protein product [Pleuronectes platessa]